MQKYITPSHLVLNMDVPTSFIHECNTETMAYQTNPPIRLI
jgi:hypothetical protein